MRSGAPPSAAEGLPAAGAGRDWPPHPYRPGGSSHGRLGRVVGHASGSAAQEDKGNLSLCGAATVSCGGLPPRCRSRHHVDVPHRLRIGCECYGIVLRQRFRELAKADASQEEWTRALRLDWVATLTASTSSVSLVIWVRLSAALHGVREVLEVSVRLLTPHDYVSLLGFSFSPVNPARMMVAAMTPADARRAAGQSVDRDAVFQFLLGVVAIMRQMGTGPAAGGTMNYADVFSGTSMLGAVF